MARYENNLAADHYAEAKRREEKDDAIESLRWLEKHMILNDHFAMFRNGKLYLRPKDHFDRLRRFIEESA